MHKHLHRVSGEWHKGPQACHAWRMWNTTRMSTQARWLNCNQAFARCILEMPCGAALQMDESVGVGVRTRAGLYLLRYLLLGCVIQHLAMAADSCACSSVCASQKHSLSIRNNSRLETLKASALCRCPPSVHARWTKPRRTQRHRQQRWRRRTCGQGSRQPQRQPGTTGTCLRRGRAQSRVDADGV